MGDFYVDPQRPVQWALITHVDHFIRGWQSYMVAQEGEHVFRTRLGDDAIIRTLP